MEETSLRILMVCMGNICRSPLAQGVLRHRLREHEAALPVEVDSAGTHGYHRGAPPDPRAMAVAGRRGIDISDLRARPVEPEDFERFDLLLAMDEDNHAYLLERADAVHHAKIRLFMDFAPAARTRIVPDPYYGGTLGFERVLDMVEEGTSGLLQELDRRLAGRNGQR